MRWLAGARHRSIIYFLTQLSSYAAGRICLELINQQLAHLLRHILQTGTDSQAEHTNLCLLVWFETQQTADFVSLGVDDSGAHHIVRVRVDPLQQLHAEAD